MRTDLWQRVRVLFEAALEREPIDVVAWLQQEEPDEAEVRDEVLGLLENHRRAGAFLSEPVRGPVMDLLASSGLDDEGGLLPGHQIGPYVVVREIGRGGMGRVYLADDTRLGRTVALKALPHAMTADASHRERLRREARAAAALSHPGICTIYALEEADGAVFIVSEFIEGRTLRSEIESGGRRSTGEITGVARELASALAAAHEKGIAHRDLKPENVMRAANGQLKILDFGLARSVGPVLDAGLGQLTMPGAIVGTPAYMAPEQLKGEQAGVRGDVFALGVLLYEYACGAHPFEAPTSIGMTARILEGKPDSLASRRPELPPAVVATIERCLQRNPDERFGSAAGVMRALAEDDDRRPASPAVSWWRIHQVAVIVLYFVACVMLWLVREWARLDGTGGLATAVFVATGIVATIAGVFRGHLMFTERVNRPALPAEQARSAPVTLGADLVVMLALVTQGGMLASSHPIAGLCIMAFGTGIGLARLILEPTTTAAAFPATR
jgi:serine/threonine-protein kinase